jgi:hypothetical protein
VRLTEMELSPLTVRVYSKVKLIITSQHLVSLWLSRKPKNTVTDHVRGDFDRKEVVDDVDYRDFIVGFRMAEGSKCFM